VFYRQVDTQARLYAVSPAMILASAIAHEVACWTRDDFRRAEQGQLRFSTEQAALIRARALQPFVEDESRHGAGQ
jgi:hypothetical protein